MSALSKILLKKNHNISSTARDVIMKPILYTLDKQALKIVMDEWQSLIMDTYKKLKKDTGIKQSYGGGAPGTTSSGGISGTNINSSHPSASNG